MVNRGCIDVTDVGSSRCALHSFTASLRRKSRTILKSLCIYFSQDPSLTFPVNSATPRILLKRQFCLDGESWFETVLQYLASDGHWNTVGWSVLVSIDLFLRTACFHRQVQRKSPPSFIEDVDSWHKLAILPTSLSLEFVDFNLKLMFIFMSLISNHILRMSSISVLPEVLHLISEERMLSRPVMAASKSSQDVEMRQ